VPGAEPPREHRPEEREHRRPRLFVSPSGEPFRGGDGLAAWFAGADADRDGALTAAEFQADALRAFALYDANRDGVIDGFEVQAYERERVPEIGDVPLGGEGEGRGRRERRGRGKQGAPAAGADSARPVAAGRDGAARFSLLNEPEPLLAADLDVDGKVTRQEWLRATARRFAALDKAGSGRLTLETLRPPQKK